jgi:hypothetical protein
MSEKETRQITQPIYYDDGDLIHACERHHRPLRRLVWTKCDMDVPDDQSFTVEGEAPAVTCRSAWWPASDTHALPANALGLRTGSLHRATRKSALAATSQASAALDRLRLVSQQRVQHDAENHRERQEN